jgi:hypothetical protein
MLATSAWRACENYAIVVIPSFIPRSHQSLITLAVDETLIWRRDDHRNIETSLRPPILSQIPQDRTRFHSIVEKRAAIVAQPPMTDQ